MIFLPLIMQLTRQSVKIIISESNLPLPMSVPFVAREKELLLLIQYVDATLSREAHCVFVGGEAGIGKTTLVSKAVEYAQMKNYKTLLGYCVKDAIVPYMPIREALRTADMDYLVTDKPPPKLECAYFINQAGILISRYERSTSSLDPDIFAGMLTAVNNFVRDTLSMLDKKEIEKRHTLNRLDYGNWTIVITPGQTVNFVGIIRGEPDEFLKEDMTEIIEKVEKAYGEILGKWHGNLEEVIGIEEILRSFINSGKYDGIDYAKELQDPKLKLNRLYENILSGLRREARKNPLMIFIDDLQWADPSTLGLIHYLSRNLKDLPVILIGTYRTEDLISDKDGKTHPLVDTMQLMDREGLLKKIELPRFSKEETIQLLEAHFGKVSHIDENFFDTLYKETGGNPLFILEVFKLLSEDQIITYDPAEKQYHLQNSLKVDKIRIPEKVQSVIEYRINHLDKIQKELLEIAAVEGEYFHSRTIEYATRMPRISVLKILNELERDAKLIHAAGEQYKFDHIKIRETIYESLNPELRKEYHALVASYIEEQNKDNLEVVSPQLALHYFSAGQKERALPYLLSAGKKTFENFAPRESAIFYQYALECIERESRKELYIECLEKLGEIHILNGNYERAQECFLGAINEIVQACPVDQTKIGVLYRKIGEIYEKLGEFEKAIDFCRKAKDFAGSNKIELSRIVSLEGLIHMRKGEFEQAIKKMEEALEMAKKDIDQKEIALIYRRIGTIQMYCGNTQEAIRILTESLEICEKINDIEGIGKTSNNLGIVYYGKGNLDLALKNFEKSMDIAKKIGDTYGIGLSNINIGNVHQDKGNLEQALLFYEKALEIKKRIGDTYGIALLYSAIGTVYLERLEFEKAREPLLQSIKLREKIGDIFGLSLSYVNLGILYKGLNNLDESLKYFEKALQIAETAGAKELMCVAYNGSAEVLSQKQEFERAMEYVNMAQSIASEICSKNLEAQCSRVLGIVKRDAKMFEEAEQAFEKALALFKDMNMDLEFAKVCYEYALMFRKRQGCGDPEKSKEFFQKAHRIFEEKKIEKWRELADLALQY